MSHQPIVKNDDRDLEPASNGDCYEQSARNEGVYSARRRHNESAGSAFIDTRVPWAIKNNTTSLTRRRQARRSATEIGLRASA